MSAFTVHAVEAPRRRVVRGHIRAARGPMTARVPALLALGVRLYLSTVWWSFGIAKLQQGWLTTNPLRPLLVSVRDGMLPTTAPGYAAAAELLLRAHLDQLLAVTLPFVELGIAAALLSGIGVRLAAAVGILVNANLILAGVASVAFDGRVLLLQLLLLVLGRAAGTVRLAFVGARERPPAVVGPRRRAA